MKPSESIRRTYRTSIANRASPRGEKAQLVRLCGCAEGTGGGSRGSSVFYLVASGRGTLLEVHALPHPLAVFGGCVGPGSPRHLNLSISKWTPESRARRVRRVSGWGRDPAPADVTMTDLESLWGFPYDIRLRTRRRGFETREGQFSEEKMVNEKDKNKGFKGP